MAEKKKAKADEVGPWRVYRMGENFRIISDRAWEEMTPDERKLCHEVQGPFQEEWQANYWARNASGYGQPATKSVRPSDPRDRERRR